MPEPLGPSEWGTLQTAPLWILSAIVGRQSGFQPLELAAFWRSVDDAGTGSRGLASSIPAKLGDDFSGQLNRFAYEERSVVTGLCDVVSILSRFDIEVGRAVTTMLLEVGERFCRARGSFGQVISREDAQTLQLLEALLDLESPVRFDHDAVA